MFASVLLIITACVVSALAAMRFVSAVRKLAACTPDTHNTRNTRNTRNTHASTRRSSARHQDKPPLVFWAVASPVIAAAFVMLTIFSL
ncbi:hypothetical protein JXM67_05170 [candidate division WOR-3 bacterium]|nr:hypothetical protein [candidate division WOR-3 bacterium]